MLWSLALHSLGRRPLRTFLTALGITVAVGSMVVFLSLGEGLRRVFSSQLGAVGPDIQVSFGDADTANPFSSVPELDLTYLDRLEAVAHEYGITGVTPVMLYFRGGFDPTSSLMFQGLPSDIEPEAYVSGFQLIEGRWFDPDETAAMVAVIGASAAERMRLGLGRELRLNPRTSFTIVGIAASDAGLVDNSVAVPLQALQAAIGIDERVSVLSLDLSEPGRAESVLLSLAGAAAGLLLGALGIAGLNLLSDRFVGIDVAALTLRLALFAVAVALLMGLLAGLLPAVRAARIPIATAMARE